MSLNLRKTKKKKNRKTNIDIKLVEKRKNFKIKNG